MTARKLDETAARLMQKKAEIAAEIEGHKTSIAELQRRLATLDEILPPEATVAAPEAPKPRADVQGEIMRRMREERTLGVEALVEGHNPASARAAIRRLVAAGKLAQAGDLVSLCGVPAQEAAE